LKNSIEYDGENIPFDVQYVNRKTLEIAVHPDSTVLIKAPLGTTPEAIQACATRRARWIKKKLYYFRRFGPRPPERRYVGGETHLFLGRQYRLKLEQNHSNAVKLKGGYFWITTTEPQNARKVKNLLDKWYDCHAKQVFKLRLEVCYQSAKGLNVFFPKLRLKRLSKRWGSCSRSGAILLNTELIKTPVRCIDYVIMHELCHLKVPHHNSEYYRLLSAYMPDWDSRKERLEKIGPLVLVHLDGAISGPV
jgi:predicted metal-dependent hydrolase